MTHPRNAGRGDLRCPFGCRQHHRRQSARARSRKHYRTAEGRRNKKRHNGKRSKLAFRSDISPLDHQAPLSGHEPLPVEEGLEADSVHRCKLETDSAIAESQAAEEREEGVPPSAGDVLPLEGLSLDETTLRNSPVLPYVAMLASLLEQRRIGRQSRREYVVRYLQQHPP